MLSVLRDCLTASLLSAEGSMAVSSGCCPSGWGSIMYLDIGTQGLED